MPALTRFAMANKMLIDATHPEETRVVVLRGNRVEEFDFESAQRKQLRGNIYLAKVTRVEPSLQAAFVDYGGNRHGFLAFSEIHPDYYQIPVADRQALIDEEERAQRAADDEDDRRSRRHRQGPRPARRDEPARGDVAKLPPAIGEEHLEPTMPRRRCARTRNSAGDTTPTSRTRRRAQMAEHDDAQPISAGGSSKAASRPKTMPRRRRIRRPLEALAEAEPNGERDAARTAEHDSTEPSTKQAPHAGRRRRRRRQSRERHADNGEAAASTEDHGDENGEAEEVVESVGGADALEEVPDRAPRHRRQYKIQEVIKRRQVMLVQVVKEERGTKGAALTTYLSLAGRYSVLMPNTARGGGISRKITSAEDRARLKEIAAELEVPEGMGVIVRTAGASRTKNEIKRDFEYLLRLWETVRDLTLKSTAPKLVYEEGSLVKRSIRDLYSKDIDEVIVAGPEAYHEAKDFMRMLMPSHAKNVKLYGDTQPLLSRYGVENQLDAMFSPVVQLRSGGYIVLNQAEALVAIDVNSGRATREHHIEDTALKTNLEASDEIARQLRLRDLAGLIVIDFIDMDEKRNNRSVERRLKECLKHDRARIQVGRISHFGLLEMSRQRIRTSVLESSTEKCPYCGGSGHVRSVSSLALQVLRALEEQLMKGATHNLIARTRPDVALYVLNQKRAHLRGLEERFAITITICADRNGGGAAGVCHRSRRTGPYDRGRQGARRTDASRSAPLEDEDDLEDIAAAEDEDAKATKRHRPQPCPSKAKAAGAGGGGAAARRPQWCRQRRHDHDRDRGRGHGHERTTMSRPRTCRDHGPEPDPAKTSQLTANGGGGGDEVGRAGEIGRRARRERRAAPRGDERRRRRGRRGGRRNRHERTATSIEPAEDSRKTITGRPNKTLRRAKSCRPPATGPELNDAVADLDARRPRHARRRRAESRAEPARAASPPSRLPSRAARGGDRPCASGAGRSAETRDAGSDRHRAAGCRSRSSPKHGEAAHDRPRRTGWWSRRFAGG